MMYSSAYEIAIKTGFSDKAANGLSFFDYDTIPPDVREHLIHIIYEAAEKYNDAVDAWDDFIKSGGQEVERTAKRKLKNSRDQKIKKAKDLLSILTRPSLLTGEPDSSVSSSLKAELWLQIFKWEQEEDPRDIVDKIAPTQPNQKFITYILEEIHNDFDIPNKTDNIKFFLPLI